MADGDAALPLPSTPTKERTSHTTSTSSTASLAGTPSSSSLRSPVSVGIARSPSGGAGGSSSIGAAASRFAGASASSPSSAPLAHSLSSTSSTHSRPSSPTATLAAYTSPQRRTGSPSISTARRTNSSGGITAGAASSVYNTSSNPLSTNNGLPSTPQRPHSRAGSAFGSRSNTPSYPAAQQQQVGSPTSPGSGNPEAALSSLQELIRTMPSAASPGPGNAGDASASAGGDRSARSSPVASTHATGNNNNNGAGQARARSVSGGSASSSTLNPNAGGFQPGALSALGEVEHEVLITPQVATFGHGISSPQSAASNTQRFTAFQQQQQQSQNAGNGNGNTVSNVFGSPIQTPQHQIGSHHNPYAATNPQEWQNYHNVFNAGIGNSGGGIGGLGNGSNAGSPANNPTSAATGNGGFSDLAAAMASLNMANNAGVGGQDYGNNQALAAAALSMNMNPMQAQLAMLQLQQQQAQAAPQQQAQGFGTPQQQAALALQQQQMQLQNLLAAQAQLTGSLGQQAQSPGGTQQVPPRFAQSQSQQDLASAASGGGNNAFMDQQLALQAQYEALRQQQQDLMNRFQEMQFQAAQLAQAQAQMSPQQQSAQQQQQQQAQIQSPQHQQQTHHQQQQSISQGQGGRQPHRRGPSQSISASTGPMGQFGSMGQFALPSQTGSGGIGLGNPGAAAQQSNLPKGHGRRHSVNTTTNKRDGNNINMAFSFPAGAGNPTQMSGGNNSGIMNNAADLSGSMGIVEESETLASSTGAGGGGGPPPTRAFGHGRRESRGSIGSLAGWDPSSVPIGQPTVNDLAQAQAQLQQLSQFRASAGHSRVPSFGVQQLQGTPGGPGGQQRKPLFAPYLPAGSIPPLLQTGKLVIGILRVNKRNRSDAYVATDVLDADVFICGSKDRNRALEGDVVAVELLDVDDVWGTKKEKEEKKRKKEESTSYDPKFQQQLRKQDKKRDDVEVEGQGLTLFEDEEVNDDQKPTYAGHVVAVVERQAGQLFAGTLGILRPSSAATKEKQDAERRERDGVDIRGAEEQRNFRPKIIWFKPVDKRVPLVAIPADQAPQGFLDRPDDYVNTLFVACIKRWPITSLHPFGSLVEELGEIGNLEAESNALLKDCGFTDETFSDNVVKCLPPVPWTIPQTEIDARKDFRQCRVFTIDPETARDLDDALHINKLDDGTYEVGVHIADVSHFVKPNTALDREARRRGTTVYLVQRASPMLPEALSSNLCSLQPGEDRLAFSSVFKMTSDGQVLSSWFGKSVIKSAAKLSYNMAQTAIDDGKLPEGVKIYDDHDAEGIAEDIKVLDSMAREMRARRFDNGALRIDNVKLSFTIDAEGRPDDCVVYERKDSHSLIEEFMLTANQAVAQKIAAGLPEQALLRRHEAPIARRLEGFGKRAGKLGFDFDITSAGSLMASFNKLSKEDPELVLRLLATKAMLKAQYVCSGMFDIAKYHHYALNIPIYTHFTSPIRRYADVIVHRQLEAALTENPEGRFVMDSESVSKIAQVCNTKKAAAKLAQETSQHLYLCALISDLTQKYGPVRRQVTVIGVLDQAFDVVVKDFGIEKRVHADQMPIENHVHDERSNTLQLYWQKGVDVIKFLAENSGDPHLQRVKETAEQHARLMEASSQSAQAESALFEDDDQEDGQVPEVAPTNLKSVQRLKSLKKEAPVFEAVEETSAGHCIQTIKELQTIPVIISSDMTVCPPVIKVFAVNPFN